MTIFVNELLLIPEDIELIAKLRVSGEERPTNIYFNFAHRYEQDKAKEQYTLKEMRRALLVWQEAIRATYPIGEAERILEESVIAKRLEDALIIYP